MAEDKKSIQMKPVTWENLAIGFAEYYLKENGIKVAITPELMKELKEKDYYDKLSKFIR